MNFLSNFLLSSLQIYIVLNLYIRKQLIHSQSSPLITSFSTTDTTSSVTDTTSSVSFFTNLFTLPSPKGILPIGSTVLIFSQYSYSSIKVEWQKYTNKTLIGIDSNVDERYSILFYTDENSILTSLLKIEHLTLDDITTYFLSTSTVDWITLSG